MNNITTANFSSTYSFKVKSDFVMFSFKCSFYLIVGFSCHLNPSSLWEILLNIHTSRNSHNTSILFAFFSVKENEILKGLKIFYTNNTTSVFIQMETTNVYNMIWRRSQINDRLLSFLCRLCMRHLLLLWLLFVIFI